MITDDNIEHLEMYLLERSVNLSENTLRTYRSILTKFLDYLEDSIKYRLKYLQYMNTLKNNVSKNYIVLTGRTIQSFYRYCKFPDTENLPIPKSKKVVRQALTKDELNELYNACNNSDEYRIVYILTNTGLRVGELCNLTWDNIHEKYIEVHGGKGDKDRIIPITKDTFDIIMNVEHICKYIITPSKPPHRGNKQNPRSIEERMTKIAGRTSINKQVTPHVLRHTYATHLIIDGMDVTFLQRILGHRYLSTTQLYVNLQNEDLMNEFNKIRN